MKANQRPTGTVTFLISDIEGSTRLVSTLGGGWTSVLEAHSEIIRDAVIESGGVLVSTGGDSFFCVFTLATDALRASVAIQQRLIGLPVPDHSVVRVRIGLHTGAGTLGGADYVGVDVHVAARISAAGHGGEILISETTRALVSDSLPDGVSLRDLGEHWLRGLDHPVRLHRVTVESLPCDFPPPRTLTAPFRVPQQLTSFIGRKEEVAHALQLLDETRLLTLTGPGGTGKTRLAIAAATAATPRFSSGVFFVSLAPVTHPDLVASAILGEIGVAESTTTPEERLKDYVADRELLLVLDNFEQVVSAAPLVSHLLADCPRLRVMVTSRAPLRIYGELELPVEPLPVPDLDGYTSIEELESFESVALFAERARAVRPDFRIDTSNSDAVVAIVNALDGLPLALELAAARVRLLSAQAIRDRLGDRLSLLTGGARDLPARQQTLHAAIAWSYDLLDLPTQTLMRRLGVFVGGFDLEQAAVVAAPETDVLDGLAELVEHNLLRRHQANALPRFSDVGDDQTLRRRASR